MSEQKIEKVPRPGRRQAFRGQINGRFVTGHDAEYLRSIIKAEDHLKTLNEVALGKLKIPDQQLDAAKFLLNKVLPNLASLKVTNLAQAKITVVEVPAVLSTTDEWERAVEERRAIAAKPVNGNGAD